MHIITDLNQIPPLPLPVGLTIGTFDGMHLGHQALLHQLQQHTIGGTQAVFTFSNHPIGTPQLCTLEHKLEQLRQLDISLVLLFSFNPQFASQPFDLFLTQLHQKLPFSYLLLGEGAAFGKDRQGTPERIKALSKTLPFTVEYLPKLLIQGFPVSSARIRQALQAGELSLVHQLLGRAYSVLAPLSSNQIINLSSLCLPPSGIYDILIHLSSKENPVHGQGILSKETLQLEIKMPKPIISSNPIEVEFIRKLS